MSFEANVIFILGPTGSGKSAMSVAVAKKLGNAEVVNADAMQVYKGFDIGTAKLSLAEQQNVIHHGFDLIDSSQTFSVQDYLKFATEVIDDIHTRGKIAVVTGGSNMYLQALIWTSDLDNKNMAETMDGDWDDLYAIDPAKAEKLHRNDVRRIQNAIASSQSSNMSEHVLRYPECHVIMMECSESDWIKSRLDIRIDNMMTQGLHAEAMHAISLFPRGKGVLQSIGYREFAEADDPTDLHSITEKIKIDTWRYFRKQLKWLNGRILPRLTLEPVRVTIEEGSLIDIDNVILQLQSRSEKAVNDDLPESPIKRFVCDKCSIEFPGKDADWLNHIKSSKHKRKRKRLD